MEEEKYNCTAPGFVICPSSRFDGLTRTVGEVHRLVLDELSKKRGWVYDENFQESDEKKSENSFPLFGPTLADLNKTKNFHDVEWFYDTKLDKGDYIQIRFYSLIKKQYPLAYDAVLFHWNAEKSACTGFNFPIYEPDSSHVRTEYFEGSSMNCHRQDHLLTFVYWESYADCADINDHDHITVKSGFIYDAALGVLKYYCPPEALT